MGGRGSSSASSRASSGGITRDGLTVSQAAIDKIRTGDLSGINMPGTAFPAQFKAALDVMSENYARPPEIDAYAQGSYANGIRHVRVTDNGDYVFVKVGSASTPVRFSGLPQLTPSQRAMWIEMHLNLTYFSAKRRGLL